MAREYQLNPFQPPPELRIDYAAELNEQQLAAVTSAPGPSLVLAGAGAGKTRTLTYRVAWLIEHGIAPDRILLLTFTNKAAREMMQRVTDLVGTNLQTLWGGTFHSLGLRILRRHPDRLGYRPDFGVADRDDAKELLAACIGESGVDDGKKLFPKPEVLLELFSKSTNTGTSVADLIAAEHESFLPQIESITLLRQRYTDRKRNAGLMDFDDLLVRWLEVLQKHEDVREVYQRRFQFVLVDEYQDTNRLQGELLDLLSARHGNLMAVGDDAQSIYSWRGANFANIIDFPARHPNTQVFKVETNYRSTPEILALANAVISGNTRQFPKALAPDRPSGTKPVVVTCGEASEQSGFVAQRVLELREEGKALADICVLYRSHFHAMELQLELTRRRIPFLITSGLRFFEQAHVKDVAAYIKLVSNPYDELAFKRLVKMLPGVGPKGADKLWQEYRGALEVESAFLPPPRRTVPVADVDGGDQVRTTPDSLTLKVSTLLSAVSGKVPKKAMVGWAHWATTIAGAEKPPIRQSPATMIRHVLKSDYIAYAEATFENARTRLEDLEQLADFAEQFSDTTEFLAQLALQTNLEAEASTSDAPLDEDRLRLSTIHQAKGLEFGTVFVIMLCDGLFPSAWSLDELEGLEEERRLFYVAVTRAKDELYLSYPLLRYTHGAGAALQQPSRFLGEFPADLVEEWNLRPAYGAPIQPRRPDPRTVADEWREADISGDPDASDDPF